MTPAGESAAKMNSMGKERVPFFFIIDFEMKKPVVLPLRSLSDNILFSTPLHPFTGTGYSRSQEWRFTKHPVSYRLYQDAFNQVMKHLQRGDSYLLNLTFATPIELTLPMMEVFNRSTAPYRLFFENRFVVFSPETFVTTREGDIVSSPMKGTIDAAIPNAVNQILEDPKETAEHHTIVDLIRNDLAMVAHNIRVTRFRYIDRIQTHEKEILQVSSEIRGTLAPDYLDHLGDLLFSLLPAGSISGAPKEKTVEIIRSAEQGDRGYYTGIFGIFDGCDLESAVMIRYIENSETGLLFRSGGGITHRSDPRKEYQEMIDKVYVAIA